MATALTAVPAAATTGSVSEALVEQLLAARVKIAALAGAFDRDRAQRLARAQRELAEQVAPVLVAAAEPLDLKLVDQLATRAVALADLAERDQGNRDRLARVQETIHKRIDELKASDRALLVKVLERQRKKLEDELALHEGREGELAQAIECIAEEIAELTNVGSAVQAAARSPAKKRGARKD
jgi:vacuolar-type H+-ATPase subunit I/STV1